jgi:CubicO group peptidase (beta-lactamase class C family)
MSACRTPTRRAARVVLTLLLALPTMAIASARSSSPEASSADSVATTLGARPIGIAEFRDWLDAARQRHRIPGLAVATLEDGALRSELVLGLADVDRKAPVTTTTRFEVASLTKPVFSRWWMQAVASGQVALDEPLANRFGDLGLGRHPHVVGLTARQLLSHQSGLPNWREPETATELPFAFAPGSGFAYSGEGYEALARVLAKVYDVDLQGLARRFDRDVAQPLGLQHFTFARPNCRAGKAAPHRQGARLSWTPCPSGLGAAGALESSAGDYARWLGQVMAGTDLAPELDLDWWRGQGVRIPAEHPARAHGLVDWSLGFARHQLPFGALWVHTGDQRGYTALALVSDDRRRGLVVLTNADAVQAFLIELVGFLATPTSGGALPAMEPHRETAP